MTNSTIKCPECGGDRNIRSGMNQYACQYCGATFVNESEVNAASAAPAMTHCRFCGGEIIFGAQKCRHCGEWQNAPVQQVVQQPIYQQVGQQKAVSSKSKVAAALLAFFLGGLGIHEFYLGKTGAGIAILLITLFTSWMIVPMFIIGVICLIQGISYLCMSDEAFAEKYH